MERPQKLKGTDSKSTHLLQSEQGAACDRYAIVPLPREPAQMSGNFPDSHLARV